MEVKREQIVYVDGKPHIKCGMVMLHANQESELCLSFKENSFGNLTDKKLVKIDSACYNLSNIETQHLYITSNQEIKKDDWYIFDVGYASGVKQADLDDIENIHLEIDPKKIIATTDILLGLPNPSQQFIEKYIEEYNKGNVITEVLVEVEEYATVKENTGWIYKGLTLKVDSVYIKDTHNGYGRNLRLSLIGTAFEETFIFNGEKRFKDAVIWEKDLIIFYKLKLDSQNQITIRKQKDSWTRNEVLVLIADLIQFIKTKHPEIKHPLAGVGVWIEENL